MRILLLAPAAPDANNGAAVYNDRIISALQILGHQAELVPLLGRYPSAIPQVDDTLLVAGLPDAALVLDGIAFGLAGPWSAGLVHHPSPLHGEQDTDRAALLRTERETLGSLPLVIATSDAVASRLAADYGVGPDRIVVVAPGVDRLPRRADQRHGPCQVLSLGALVPWRKHDVLLRALARLPDLAWRLTLIGSHHRDPAHVAALRTLIAATRTTERVTLADAAADLPWDRTDVLALAHPVPGTLGAMQQALRRGIPLVLATAEAGLGEAEGCATCLPGDEEALSKVLRRVIYDRGLRLGMAEAAWQAGQRLPDWAEQARRFAAALECDRFKRGHPEA
jgi:glycosyltransferase involved in cell wall biosynthesis